MMNRSRDYSIFLEPVKNIYKEAKSKVQNEKRRNTNHINSISTALVEGKVPKGLSDVFARILYNHEDRLGGSFYVPLLAHSSSGPLGFQYGADTNTWAQPIGFLDGCETPDNPFSTALAESYDAVKEHNFEKVCKPQ